MRAGTGIVETAPLFSLAQTCGPVAWGRGRWPSVDWIDGELVWVGWGEDGVLWRRVRQQRPGELVVSGSADDRSQESWATAVLGVGESCPAFLDPVLERLRLRYRGLGQFAAGSLFDGLVSSIVGQSISVAAAAVTERRLAELFHPGLELAGRRFWPPPRPDQLANADAEFVRRSGVTWRRAEALVAIGRAAADEVEARHAGRLPTPEAALTDPDAARDTLRRLPLVGPWTVESALLWGVGHPDAYPMGDVALLRAARRAYGDPELDRAALDRLADGWRPARGWAARLLWTDLLGCAPLRQR